MECFNLIYRLLAVSFITLVLIGIGLGWDKCYMFPLFLATCLLLFERCIRTAYDYVVKLCKFVKYKVEACFQKNILKLVNSLDNYVLRWDNNCELASLSLLSPKEDRDAHKEYIERLKAAIDNSNVHNVALTGAYGSGKSSILKTFKACYPHYKYVDISLATFEEHVQNEGKDEDKLEYRILQQLFYHVKMSDISDSRFGRIERTSLSAKIGLTFSICLLVACYLCLFKVEWLECIFPDAKMILEHNSVKIVAFLLFSLVSILMVFKFVHFYKRLGIRNLGVKFSSASLEIEDRKNVTAMNRYLDEIIYLFQKKKYEVVFFEDLDRFENIQIFTKLRELNQILNQSEEIKQRVVFVYALCDNVFSTPEARTKFFDYIIPVIPFVNVSNSGDLFKRSFMNLQIPEEKLSTEFLTDISHFVNDTRVLKNIINEFMLYHKILDPKLNLEHLLAIILYKNLYPKDFCLLHQGKGLVCEAFASVPFFKKNKREDMLKQIKEIEETIKRLDNETLKNIKELNSIVVAHFLKQDYGDNWQPADSHRDIIMKELLFDDSNVALILQGNMGFVHYNQYRSVTKATMNEALGENFDYNGRRELIEQKNSGIIKQLQEKRKDLVGKMAFLDKLLLHEIVRNVHDVFTYVEDYKILPDSEKQKYQVLAYLLKEGYIDEDYFYYISLFQEGRLTPHDNDFLLSVKFDEPKEYDYKLTEIETIVSNLKVSDFDNPAIINFDLLQFLLEREEKYSDKCDSIITTIVKNLKLDLVYAYAHGRGSVSVFIRKLTNFYPAIWKDVSLAETFTHQQKMEILALIFAYAEIDVIRNMDECYSFSVYLNKSNDYLKSFAKCNKEKGLAILDTIDLQVEILIDAETVEEDLLLKHICLLGMYAINHDNIRFIANIYELGEESQETSLYTLVKQSNLHFLSKHICSHVDEFAKAIVNDNSKFFVSEDEIIDLLKNKDVEYDTKVDLIHNKKFLIKDETEISLDILPYVYEENKIMPTISNIKDYYERNDSQIKRELENFINDHFSELCDEVKVCVKTETGFNEFLFDIIKKETLKKELARSIFDNPFLLNTWNEHVRELKDDQLFYVIYKKIISPDNMNVVVADRFLHYYMQDDSEFDYGLYVEALDVSQNDLLKALAITKCIEKRLLHVKQIPDCLSVMGKTFEGFKNIGETVKVPKTSGLKAFMNTLHSIKYLGAVKTHGNELSAKVLKH